MANISWLEKIKSHFQGVFKNAENEKGIENIVEGQDWVVEDIEEIEEIEGKVEKHLLLASKDAVEDAMDAEVSDEGFEPVLDSVEAFEQAVDNLPPQDGLLVREHHFYLGEAIILKNIDFSGKSYQSSFVQNNSISSQTVFSENVLVERVSAQHGVKFHAVITGALAVSTVTSVSFDLSDLSDHSFLSSLPEGGDAASVEPSESSVPLDNEIPMNFLPAVQGAGFHLNVVGSAEPQKAVLSVKEDISIESALSENDLLENEFLAENLLTDVKKAYIAIWLDSVTPETILESSLDGNLLENEVDEASSVVEDISQGQIMSQEQVVLQEHTTVDLAGQSDNSSNSDSVDHHADNNADNPNNPSENEKMAESVADDRSSQVSQEALSIKSNSSVSSVAQINSHENAESVGADSIDTETDSAPFLSPQQFLLDNALQSEPDESDLWVELESIKNNTQSSSELDNSFDNEIVESDNGLDKDEVSQSSLPSSDVPDVVNDTFVPETDSGSQDEGLEVPQDLSKVEISIPLPPPPPPPSQEIGSRVESPVNLSDLKGVESEKGDEPNVKVSGDSIHTEVTTGAEVKPAINPINFDNVPKDLADHLVNRLTARRQHFVEDDSSSESEESSFDFVGVESGSDLNSKMVDNNVFEEIESERGASNEMLSENLNTAAQNIDSSSMHDVDVQVIEPQNAIPMPPPPPVSSLGGAAPLSAQPTESSVVDANANPLPKDAGAPGWVEVVDNVPSITDQLKNFSMDTLKPAEDRVLPELASLAPDIVEPLSTAQILVDKVPEKFFDTLSVMSDTQYDDSGWSDSEQDLSDCDNHYHTPMGEDAQSLLSESPVLSEVQNDLSELPTGSELSHEPAHSSGWGFLSSLNPLNWSLFNHGEHAQDSSTAHQPEDNGGTHAIHAGDVLSDHEAHGSLQGALDQGLGSRGSDVDSVVSGSSDHTFYTAETITDNMSFVSCASDLAAFDDLPNAVDS